MLEMKAIAAAVLVAATLTFAPASAAPSVGHAKEVAKVSIAGSIWHLPGRGFRLQDRHLAHTTVLPHLKQALGECGGDRACRTSQTERYDRLRLQWRALNRSLWFLVRSLPHCSADLADNCVRARRGQAAKLVVSGRRYVAQQKRFFRP